VNCEHTPLLCMAKANGWHNTICIHTHTHANIVPSSYQGRHHKVGQCARASVSQDKITEQNTKTCVHACTHYIHAYTYVHDLHTNICIHIRYSKFVMSHKINRKLCDCGWMPPLEGILWNKNNYNYKHIEHCIFQKIDWCAIGPYQKLFLTWFETERLRN